MKGNLRPSALRQIATFVLPTSRMSPGPIGKFVELRKDRTDGCCQNDEVRRLIAPRLYGAHSRARASISGESTPKT